MILDIRVEQPEGREQSGAGRNDDPLDVELRRHAGGEQRPVAAECEQRELARIAPALARYRADRTDHVRRRDLICAIGRILDRHLQRRRDGLGEHRARLLGVELERAADEMLRIDVAEQHVGVGDGRHSAALIVTDRTGRGARALRSDLQSAARVDPDVRAAAGADFGEIDRRHLQRIARAGQQPRTDHDAGADRIFLRARHLAVLHHRGLRGGAAHVEGDDLRKLLRARDRLRADHAAGRAGLDDIHRLGPRRPRRWSARHSTASAAGAPGCRPRRARRAARADRLRRSASHRR